MGKKKAKMKTSFMFPTLHQDVVRAVSDTIASPWYRESHENTRIKNEYTSYVMGKFKCVNGACTTDGWGSKKVTILIRGYDGNGYDATVFNQRCRGCRQLGRLTLDEQSYVERVAYRIQKWAGVHVERQPFASTKGLPHKRDLCEGCKRGICHQSND